MNFIHTSLEKMKGKTLFVNALLVLLALFLAPLILPFLLSFLSWLLNTFFLLSLLIACLWASTRGILALKQKGKISDNTTQIIIRILHFTEKVFLFPIALISKIIRKTTQDLNQDTNTTA